MGNKNSSTEPQQPSNIDTNANNSNMGGLHEWFNRCSTDDSTRIKYEKLSTLLGLKLYTKEEWGTFSQKIQPWMQNIHDDEWCFQALVSLLFPTQQQPSLFTVDMIRDLLVFSMECWATIPCYGVAAPDELQSIDRMAANCLLANANQSCSLQHLSKYAKVKWKHLGQEIPRLFLHLSGGNNAPPPFLSSSSAIATSRVLQWQLWLLPYRDPEPIVSWSCLYSNKAHGQGASALYRAVGLYPAPSLVLVRSKAGDIFEFYCDTQWGIGAKGFWGNSNCFLFAMSPTFSVFRTTPYSKNYAYFHIPNGKGLVPDGLGVGGQLEAFRLSIDGDLNHGIGCKFDSTYEEGTLCELGAKEDVTPDSVEFSVDSLEVWGLGGEAALTSQEAARQREIKEAMKRRQVNKKIMLGGDSDEENPDKWILEMGGAHESYVKDANHV